MPSAAEWNAEEARRDLAKLNPELSELIFKVIKQGADDAYRRVRDQSQQEMCDFHVIQRKVSEDLSRHLNETLLSYADKLAACPTAEQVDAIGARLEQLDERQWTQTRIVQDILELLHHRQQIEIIGEPDQRTTGNITRTQTQRAHRVCADCGATCYWTRLAGLAIRPSYCSCGREFVR